MKGKGRHRQLFAMTLSVLLAALMVAIAPRGAWAEVQHQITTKFDTERGTVDAPASAATGETVTLVARPKDGYGFNGIWVAKSNGTGGDNDEQDNVEVHDVKFNEDGSQSITFVMPDSAVNATVSFSSFHNISVKQPEGGTVKVENDRAVADVPIELTATANDGYTFSKFVVTDATGNELEIEHNYPIWTRDAESGVESEFILENCFMMPDSDVTITAVFTKNSASSTTRTTSAVYRAYNPNSGEHFYTANKAEYDNLVSLGWNGEGEAWQTLDKNSGTPVYRLYNPNAGEHHYTTSKAEYDYLQTVGWKGEGIGFYAADKDSGIPVYRAYNPNQFACNHHWTTSKGEFDHIVDVGWNNEGIAWYAPAA